MTIDGLLHNLEIQQTPSVIWVHQTMIHRVTQLGFHTYQALLGIDGIVVA